MTDPILPLVVDWDDTYVRVAAARVANEQVRTVAPDKAMDDDDARDLAAAEEIITAHRSGLIDLNSDDFAHTWSLLFDTLCQLEEAYPLALLTTNA